jgi:hypothetical protein
VTRFLLIALLVGSPRDVANHVSKHRVELPPEPLVVQRKASVAPTPAKAITLTLSFDNPNTNSQRWVIESTKSATNPVWQVLTNGTVVANGNVAVIVDHQGPSWFYRAGFIWP